MSGKTSAASKNKWITANLDRINLTMPKGKKELLKAVADDCGLSVNAFINQAIDEKLAEHEKREGN